ncbi:hypothetical protein BH11PSE3_BH11PSE3_48520 [soil metagenome]
MTAPSLETGRSMSRMVGATRQSFPGHAGGIWHRGQGPGVVRSIDHRGAAKALGFFPLKSVSVELPTSDVAFPGPANATAITNNCLACHSAGMVLTQPDLSKAAWTGIVEKMIHDYKAPVSEGGGPAIVDYLQDIKVAK